MPKRSSRKRPSDLNQLAANIVQEATGDKPEVSTNPAETPVSGKNPAAVALGRLGGKIGGKARAAKLTPEQRKEIAQNAARARWRKV